MPIFARIFLPFALFVYIAIETYMKHFQESSLCEATGCKLAGELLKFDAIYLNYFGLIGLFFMFIFGYISLKSTFFKSLFFMMIYGAIAFETTIITYQFIANPEACIFCLTILSSLILIALLSNAKHFIFVLSAMGAIIIGLHTLNIVENKSSITENGRYLIQSENCGHCQKVKAYFAKENIKYKAIPISEVNARSFLKFIDISSIPVLIQKSPSEIKILKGDKAIIAFFENKKVPIIEAKTNETEIPKESSSSLGLPTELPNFLAGGEDEGCAITITQAPSCEDNSSN